MIEIARVEPKKIQRKLLTKEQRQRICEKHSEIWQVDGKKYCDIDCPLRADISDGIGGKMDCNCKQISIIEKALKKYWNGEIEVSE